MSVCNIYFSSWISFNSEYVSVALISRCTFHFNQMRWPEMIDPKSWKSSCRCSEYFDKIVHRFVSANYHISVEKLLWTKIYDFRDVYRKRNVSFWHLFWVSKHNSFPSFSHYHWNRIILVIKLNYLGYLFRWRGWSLTFSTPGAKTGNFSLLPCSNIQHISEKITNEDELELAAGLRTSLFSNSFRRKVPLKREKGEIFKPIVDW